MIVDIIKSHNKGLKPCKTRSTASAKAVNPKSGVSGVNGGTASAIKSLKERIMGRGDTDN